MLTIPNDKNLLSAASNVSLQGKQPPSEEHVSDNEEYKFRSTVKLRSESDDERLKADMVVAAMNFSQHEFVKMSEVGQLI